MKSPSAGSFNSQSIHPAPLPIFLGRRSPADTGEHPIISLSITRCPMEKRITNRKT
jgi:hypothetical protein